MTTKFTNQLCVVCGGELKRMPITHEEKRASHIYLFQNVPAQICTACGEVWIDEEVLQHIEQLIETGISMREVETSLYDFTRTSTPAH